MHPYSPWAPSVHTHRPNAQITQPPCRSAKLRVTQAQNRSSDRDTRLCCSTYCVTPLGARLASDWPRLAAAIAVSKCERSSHELISAFAATAVPSDQPSEEKALINRAGIAMQTRSAIKKAILLVSENNGHLSQSERAFQTGGKTRATCQCADTTLLVSLNMASAPVGCMYRVTPIYEEISGVELPDCMYRVANVYGETCAANVPNGGVSGSCSVNVSSRNHVGSGCDSCLPVCSRVSN